MKKQFLLTAAVLSLTVVSRAQFEKSYGSGQLEWGRSVQFTTGIDYVIGGRTDSVFFGGSEATMLLKDANGGGGNPPYWEMVYGGANTDIFHSVREVTNPNPLGIRYIAAGQTNSFGFGLDDFYFTGTNGGGIPVVMKTFGGANQDRAYCTQQITDPFTGGPGGYVIVGESNSFNNAFGANFNIYVVRLNPAGNFATAAVIGGSGQDRGYWIEQTSDGGFIVVGSTTTQACTTVAATTQDIFVVKLDYNLNVLWNNIIGINSPVLNNDIAYCVKEDPSDSSLVITGGTRSFGAGAEDAFVLRMGKNGAPIFWFFTYGGANVDVGRTLLIDNINSTAGTDYVISGYSNSFNPAANMDAYVFKINPGGGPIWSSTYGGTQPDQGYEITRSDVPGYAVVGDVRSFGAGNSDIYLIEMNTFGDDKTQCDRDSMHIVGVPPYCVINSAQRVYVGNYFDPPRNYHQIVYRRDSCAFDPVVPVPAVTKLQKESADGKSFLSFAPNPATDNLNIMYSADYAGYSVKIMDAQGKLVRSFTLSGNGSESISLQGLPAGLYMMNLQGADGTTRTERFIKSE